MRAVELTLFPEEGAFPGVDVALAGAPAVERDALCSLEWHTDGSSTLVYRCLAPDRSQLAAVFEDHDDVRRFELVDGQDDRVYAVVHVDPHPTLNELLEIADEHALLLDPPFHFTDSGVRVTVAGAPDAIGDAFDAVSDRIPLHVEWTGGYDPDAADVLGRLTERQREALAVAYDLGYYETPRAASFDRVAEELGCARSTANELLRRAEGVLVEAVLNR